MTKFSLMNFAPVDPDILVIGGLYSVGMVRPEKSNQLHRFNCHWLGAEMELVVLINGGDYIILNKPHDLTSHGASEMLKDCPYIATCRLGTGIHLLAPPFERFIQDVCPRSGCL